ncbi:hypothetical protein VZT92_023881 [Zoarces viviparus]|uniref:DUF6729 domain-containing protein n=1 Tax=Zoarces viviparus TaxID=48416 RepID=A0AAW1E803_ZOAVI
MRGRTLGNSASRLRSYLVEQHTAAWMNSCIRFMSIYKKFMMPGATVPPPPALPAMDPVPTRQWILSAYATDTFTRLEEMRAKVTSVFGSILKMDSTKKITRKLAGHAAGTAQWVTNVGNEHGQVLMSVLTVAEGYGLQEMTSGLVRRYSLAKEEPPLALYVDRDCCSVTGGSAAAALFPEWTQLVVRLDIWHFIRRLAAMVTTESHPLYAHFMRRLSTCIFAWDQEDIALLKSAKDAEGPGAWSRVSVREMARHCRRRTRGAQETERLIEEALDHFKSAKDSMAILLLDQERVDGIWSTQRRHLQCIQDPPGLQLYTRTGQLTKGGVSLPVYRCSRGSTSLESFHLHRFIPGTSASAMNFQLYLLQGLTRWNEDRGRAAVEGGDSQQQRSYSSQDLDTVNQLAQHLYGTRLVDSFTRIREYTGELIGVNYLFSQTGQVLQELPDDPDVSEGQAEEEEDGDDDNADLEEGADERFQELLFDTEFLSEPSQPRQPEPADDLQDTADEQECRDTDGSPGYQHVLNLAECLVELRVTGRVTVVAGGQAPYRAKKPEEMDAEAWAHVTSEGGDTTNATLVLSRWKMQFGRYQGKIFLWLLENDVGYCVNVVASHQKERERTGSQSPLMANKDAFTCHFLAYPEFAEAVRFHRAFEEARVKSLKPGQEGQALVGFGDFTFETLQSLYESEDTKKIRFVNYLRRKAPAPGTQMENAVHHLNWFIPGTRASAKHFQAFLVDGLVRGHLKHVLNQKSQRVLDFTKPAEYTGELIGVEYLYQQTGRVLEDVSLDPDTPDEAAAIESLEEEDECIAEDVEDPTIFEPDRPAQQQPGQVIQLTHRLSHPVQPPLTRMPLLRPLRFRTLFPSSPPQTLRRIYRSDPSGSVGSRELDGEQPGPSSIGRPPPPPATLPGVFPAPVPASHPPLPGPHMSRSTTYRKRKAAEAAAAGQGSLPRSKPRQPTTQYVCTKCSQPKTLATGHTRLFGEAYCASVGGKTVEEWREEMNKKHKGGP